MVQASTVYEPKDGLRASLPLCHTGVGRYDKVGLGYGDLESLI